MLEIERKYLTKSTDYREHAISRIHVAQGFLSTDPERVVRIRIMGDMANLTIKGLTNESGTTRFEWERDIPIAEARELLKLCKGPLMEKYRYNVPVGKHLYEVDEFLGANEGLVVAEIELGSENETFTKPAWLGREVTGEMKYYNTQLSTNPYSTWKEKKH